MKYTKENTKKYFGKTVVLHNNYKYIVKIYPKEGQKYPEIGLLGDCVGIITIKKPKNFCKAGLFPFDGITKIRLSKRKVQ